MLIKVFKGLWALSLFATVGIFLYVYASLPEDIQLAEGGIPLYISRNGLFYSGLALLAVLNAFVFIVSRLYSNSHTWFLAWFYGLLIFLNLFIVVVLQFLNLYNSHEKFNYDNIGVIIYGALGLVMVWSSLWPVYFVSRKLLSQAPRNG